MKYITLPIMLLLVCALAAQPTPSQAQSTLRNVCHFFQETQQAVCGLMLYRWRSEGIDQDGQPGFTMEENAALFGYPITGQYTEGTMTYQQFQHAIFSYETARFPTAPVTVVFTQNPAPGPIASPPPPPPPSSGGPPQGDLLQPQAVARTEDGSTVIVIRNDSPDTIRLTVNGPETHTITVAGCPTCDYYTTPPTSCRPEASVAGYTVLPGTYDVRTEPSANVQALQGRWTLEAGFQYETCLFIVEGP